MKLRIRLLALVTAVGMAATILSGCQEPLAPEESEEPVARAELPETEPNLQETDELVIWTNFFNMGPDASDGLDQLFQEKTGIQVTVERLYPVSMEAYSENGKTVYALKKDWNGKVPDLILMTESPGWNLLGPAWSETEETYWDIYELFESGVFLDLNTIIEQDETFDLELYDERMVEAGQYRGKQYLFPLGSSPGGWTLEGGQEVLEEAGFSPEAWEDATSLIQELARIQGMNVVENVLVDDVNAKWVQEAVFHASHPELVDRETGMVTATREGLRDFCQAWKALFYDSTLDTTAVHSPTATNNQFIVLRDKDALFTLTEAGNYYTMAGVKTVYTPISRTMPDVNGTVNGGGIESVGICAEGKNQKNAWEFIKFLLSVEVQEIRREEKETCLPSVLSEQEKLIQANIERAERMAKIDFTCGVGEALDEEEIAYYRETVQGADYYEYSSPEVYRRFCEAMEPYFQGEERYEVCVDQLKDSLREYLAGR